jgi:SAM-dependent methyltransferase
LARLSKKRNGMHNFDFSDHAWRRAVESHEIPPDLKTWALLQVSRGQDYYIRRIRQLGLAGQRVLDAGCGMGNWSLGLARWFDEVHAIEVDRSRLQMLSAVADRFDGHIVPHVASVESLPFTSRSFDAIFCNGVLFVTDYRKTLGEFARVLKPDGVLYITYTALAWWIHIARDRGANEPECVVYGCNAFINLLFRTLDELQLEHSADTSGHARLSEAILRTGYVEPRRGLEFRGTKTGRAFERYAADRHDSAAAVETTGRFLDACAATLQSLASASTQLPLVRTKLSRTLDLLALLRTYGTSEYHKRAALDLFSRLVFGRSRYEVAIATHSFEPEDMIDVLMHVGFRDLVTAWEGSLARIPIPDPPPALYSREQGVYEVLGRGRVA